MNIVITYNSKTGFTKKYAEWIAKELGCSAIPYKELRNVSAYDLVIHGGWIMGGMITGLEDIKKMSPAKLIAFGVGSTQDDHYVQTVRETTYIEDFPVYYFVGGMNPEKMNFLMKFIVKKVTKSKPVYEDHSDSNAIQPLVQYVRKMC